ncbi:cryptochrome/photolyase family protein [Elongatibacter sediminis]|uniref:Deoxyribodipyrimidine photo-lyase n=1 Tax=Elongatibacter sediminis TaxID=3119006 RepID=A0AAW9RGV9_9GAMM
MSKVIIAWFRQDLRIRDNPVLAEVLRRDAAVLPVYIHAPEEDGAWAPGAASRWWLYHALAGLAGDLEALGLPLVIRRGSPEEALTSIVASMRGAGHPVDSVACARVYEPDRVQHDEQVREVLDEVGVGWWQGNASLLIEPEHVCNKSGDPFRVFTPFWKHLRGLPPEPPVAVDADRLEAPDHVPDSLALDDLELLPTRSWDDGIAAAWDPSPAGARTVLEDFVEERVTAYKRCRDVPGVNGTSRLSPYLHSGQVGPRQVWAAVHAAGGADNDGGFTFLSEVAWREFAYHLLHHFPRTTDEPMYEKYRDFPWAPDPQALQAWQKGRTGYPFVDAGMRQLWKTGWMHNRVRMVAASFLVKHLLQPWQDGARWFWDTLVDADLASNTMGWQWVAGSGADAAPYFRIFNPFGQGEKFDPDGDYVREFVPELAGLPDKYIHRPWEAPDEVLAKAGVVLGETYPEPIIEHRAGRQRALDALEATRQQAG